jgi:hypothetical protein
VEEPGISLGSGIEVRFSHHLSLDGFERDFRVAQ